MTAEFQDKLTRAHYCDIAERYQDMAKEMREVLEICTNEKHEITVPIRNLFSLAYKNLVSTRRSSWRVLYSERQRLEEKQSEDLHIVDELLEMSEKELISCCDEVLSIIETHALGDIESKSRPHQVFFLKMKADYYRYKAEVLAHEEEKEASDLALKNYLKAKELADLLKPTDPVRLGLYLNFSVFNYEILNNYDLACDLAREAFNAAISGLDTLGEDYYKDSTLIMQLLRDNITLWTSKRDQQNQQSQQKMEEPPAPAA